MSRIFISHSSSDDHAALALREWLSEEGWSSDDDVFLDIHSDSGMAAGQRWLTALEDAATRCEAVIFLVSNKWLNSQWCADEMRQAQTLNKRMFTLLVEDVDFKRLPGSLTAEWQVVRLYAELDDKTARRFRTNHPISHEPGTSNFAEDGLRRLKKGLLVAGLGADSFELQADPDGPFGWRMPYRGLEPLQAADAAVFFGRDADIVRGIDTLRGLSSRKPPRMLVILGASGSGKSSYLRAGLLPRLERDEIAWLTFPPIRVADHGAFEGSEGLLKALIDVHERFGERVSRADLRAALSTPKGFIGLLESMREKAAKRVLIDDLSKAPIPLICIDQAEELSLADANPDATELLELLRAAMDTGNLMLLATIRSDSYDALQSLKPLRGVHQSTLSLAPIPRGEVARIIRGPAKVLARQVGPECFQFSAEVVEALQREMGSETDALPLLAFALQRLAHEHEAARVIGMEELESTGGVDQAISAAGESALNDAGVSRESRKRKAVLRSVFIPRLALIDPVSHKPQRRVAGWDMFEEEELQPVIQSLQDYRLLVTKGQNRPTLEVAHESLLRHWPELSDLLMEDRDSLLKLDIVQRGAKAWQEADDANKDEYLVLRGQRLKDAKALLERPDFRRELSGAGTSYIAACAQEEASIEARETSQRRTRRILMGSVASLVVIASVITAVYAKRVENNSRNLSNQASRLIGMDAEKSYVNEDFERAMRIALLGIDHRYNSAHPLTRWTLARSAFSSRLLAGLSEHADPLYSASFSPSGQRIVTASEDHTARVWTQAEDGSWQVAVLEGHSGPVKDAEFSPDESQVATVSDDTHLRVWTEGGDQTWNSVPLAGHNQPIDDVLYSASGEHMVTLSGELGIRLWSRNADGAWASQLLTGHDSRILHATWSPTEERLLTTSADNTARVWTKTPEGAWQSVVLRGHEAPVNHGAFAPDGDRLATADTQGETRVWWQDDSSQWTHINLTPHGGVVNQVSFSPNGEFLATASRDRSVRVWKKNPSGSGEWSFESLEDHEGPVTLVDWSRASDRIVTVSGGTSVRIWVQNAGDQWVMERRLDTPPGRVTHAEFSPEGEQVITASGTGSANIWKAEAPGLSVSTALKGHVQPVSDIEIIEQTGQVVTSSLDQTARVWTRDPEGEWSSEVLLGHSDSLTNVAVSPATGQIVTTSADSTARVWNREESAEWTSEVLAGHEGVVNTVTFSPDGNLLATVSEDQTVRLWNRDGEGTWSATVLRGHETDVVGAGFSNDSSTLVTGDMDGGIKIWEQDEQGEWQAQELVAHFGRINRIDFSRNGQFMLTASVDQFAVIWQKDEQGQWIEAEALSGHEGAVNYAAFLEIDDRLRVVTTSDDGTARIWWVDDEGEFLNQSLQGHQGPVTGAALSSDGQQVVTTSADGSIRLWMSVGREVWSPQLLEAHDASVSDAVFSNDDQWLVTASDDHTARVWEFGQLTSREKPVQFAETVCREILPPEARRVTRNDSREVPLLRDFIDEDVCARFLK